MADIIFAMAALFSDMNCASRLPARELTPPIRPPTNSAGQNHEGECRTRYISNPIDQFEAQGNDGLTCCDRRSPSPEDDSYGAPRPAGPSGRRARRPSGRVLRLVSSSAEVGTGFPP